MAGKTKYERVLEEDRRAKISITKQLNQLLEIQGKISEDYEHMSTAQVGALRLQSDIALKLLAKRLPDLKAVEVSGTDGGPMELKLVSFLDVSAEQLEA